MYTRGLYRVDSKETIHCPRYVGEPRCWTPRKPFSWPAGNEKLRSSALATSDSLPPSRAWTQTSLVFKRYSTSAFEPHDRQTLRALFDYSAAFHTPFLVNPTGPPSFPSRATLRFPGFKRVLDGRREASLPSTAPEARVPNPCLRHDGHATLPPPPYTAVVSYCQNDREQGRDEHLPRDARLRPRTIGRDHRLLLPGGRHSRSTAKR